MENNNYLKAQNSQFLQEEEIVNSSSSCILKSSLRNQNYQEPVSYDNIFENNEKVLIKLKYLKFILEVRNKIECGH